MTARLALVLAAILVAGCIREPPEPRGTAEGTVLIGPTCPVQRDPPEPGCEDRPYETQLEAVLVGNLGDAVRFWSNNDGTFSVPLVAGTYSIRSASDAPQPPTCSSPEFTVVAHATTHVDVSCDSGIR